MLMRYLNAFIAIVLVGSWLYFGNRPLNTGTAFLPPIGTFFCPSTGFWQNAESWKEEFPDRVSIPDLLGEVDVRYNERRVPYIYGDHLIDLVAVQGYLHARDRLWQMDINTRAAAGQISEILGERALSYDRRQRNYGLLRSAEETLDRWSDEGETLRYLKAYTRGVNTYIEQLSPAHYPLEFKLLHYEPQPWKPLHSILFLKNMQQTLAKKQQDLEYTNAAALFGRDSLRQLFPDWFPQQRPVISEDRSWSFQAIAPDTTVPKASINLRKGEAPNRIDDRDGSNSWALSGEKTASGHPVLCNDPHLGLTLPSIWYELQLSNPNFTSYGVSFPGLPFVIIGFNEHIAWGITNGGHDVLDWYELDWNDRQQGLYRLGDSVYRATPQVDTIEIRGQDPLLLQGWETRYGSVWNEPGHPMDGIAMHWLANDALPGNEFKTFLLLNTAENYSDFKEALRYFNSPIQNFAFASREDTIAMHTQGAHPVKPSGYGKFVLDGSSGKRIPHRMIPFQHLPHEVNPKRQYVASANQHSTIPDYPYAYHGFFADYRGRYLNARLDSLRSAELDDMKHLQMNSQSLHATEGLQVLNYYRDTLALPPAQRDTLLSLLAWNGNFRAESWQPAFYALWWDEFKHMVWDEFRREDIPLTPPEDWTLARMAREEGAHPLFDQSSTAEREQAIDLVSLSFNRTFSLWDSLYTTEGEPVNWALYNNAHIDHLAGLPGFGSQRLEIDGYRYALNAQSATKGPSWRMIVHLDDPIEAYGVYPGGQSGNPGSRYYDLQIERWKKGEYYEIRFAPNKDQISDQTVQIQRFKSEE